MHDCLIGFGSNLGNGKAIFEKCLASLGQFSGISACRASRLYRTAPVGGPANQPDFLNAAIRMTTSLAPTQTLCVLRDIETEQERVRGIRWAPRTADLDLLLYDDLIMNSADLTIPHPAMMFRRFVLEPANDIAGDMVHPQILWTLSELCGHAREAFPYFAVTSDDKFAAMDFAKSFARSINGRLVSDERFRSPQKPVREDLDFRGDKLIELDRRGRALIAAIQDGSRGPVVTDYWLDEPIALAKVQKNDDLAAELTDRIGSLQGQGLPAAKLVIGLEYDAGENSPRSPQKQHQGAIMDYLRSCRKVPFLVVDANNLKSAYQEVIGAVTAMESMCVEASHG